MVAAKKIKRTNQKNAADRQKKSVYFSPDMISDINTEATKWGVSFSKILCDCVLIAKFSKAKRPHGVIAFTDIPKGVD